MRSPTVEEILELLRRGERPAAELVGALSLSQPAVSKHLRVLREAGMVGVRGEAQRRLYRLRPEPLCTVDQRLAPYRAMRAAALTTSNAISTRSAIDWELSPMTEYGELEQTRDGRRQFRFERRLRHGVETTGAR